MENIVAVEVTLDSGDHRYFLTWGRIQDAIDPAPLEQIVLRKAVGFSLGGTPISARVCSSLHDGQDAPYFHECFFAMCQKPIPFGKRYRKWRLKMDKAIRSGKELYFLGQDLPSGAPD